jgi:flagellar motor switch protein FliN
VELRALTQTIAEEFAAVAAAVLGGDPIVTPAAAGASPVWAIRFTVQGAATGAISLAVPVADAATYTGRVLGFDDEPPEDAITDNLIESAKQAAGAFNVSQGPGGIKLAVVEPAVTMAEAPADSAWSAITVSDLVIHVALGGTLEAVRPAPGPMAAQPAHVPAPPAPSGPAVPQNLDLILDIDLPLWVRFGQTAMTLHALSRLGPGTTIDLDRSPDDPVDVLVNDTIVARGEVVVVSGNYGVRVTEVVSTSDRIRSMGSLN